MHASTMAGEPTFRFGWGRGLLFPLLILSVTYTLFGLACLAWDIGTSYPIDLRLRWIEERFVWEGVNPQEAGHPDDIVAINHQLLTTLGAGYPPWAYSIGLILVPPVPWWLTRWYAVSINSAALVGIGWWAYNQAKGYGHTWGWVSAGSALALFPTAICLSYGQYSVIVAGCLAAADHLLERQTRGGDILAGFALGVACVKPHLGGLFVLAVLLEGRLISFAACSAFLLASSGLTWFLTGADPVTMFRRSFEDASAFAFVSHNPLAPILEAHFGFRSATTILGLAGLLAFLLSAKILKTNCRLIGWSVCAVISMYWGYRKHYDAVLMLFPLVGLLRVALERREAIWFVAYLALGLSLWIPIRDSQWHVPVVKWTDLVLWLVVAAMFVWRGKNRSQPLFGPNHVGGLSCQ